MEAVDVRYQAAPISDDAVRTGFNILENRSSPTPDRRAG